MLTFARSYNLAASSKRPLSSVSFATTSIMPSTSPWNLSIQPNYKENKHGVHIRKNLLQIIVTGHVKLTHSARLVKNTVNLLSECHQIPCDPTEHRTENTYTHVTTELVWGCPLPLPSLVKTSPLLFPRPVHWRIYWTNSLHVGFSAF